MNLNRVTYWLRQLALWAVCGVAAEALGAEAPDGGASVVTTVDEAHVVSQVASFAATKLKDSPAVVTVLSGEDLRNSGARDLIDVLSLVPGFFIGADVLGVTGPGFRGLWGHEGKILLMIDGKEMNELLYSTMQLGNEFPIELIERVEVVRGPGSVIYGGNAELAVINVVTRSLQGASDFVVAGTYGQQSFSDLGQGYGRRSLTVSGRYVVDAIPGLSMFSSASIGQGHRSARDYVDPSGASAPSLGTSNLDPVVVQTGLGYRGFNATLIYRHLYIASPAGQGDAIASAPSIFDALHADVQGAFHLTDRFELTPRLTFTYQVPWRTPDQESDLYYDKSVSRTRARLIARWAPLDELQLTVGGDAMFDHAQLNGPVIGLMTQFGDKNSVDSRTFAGFLELFSENPIVNVAVGARYDNTSEVGGALVPRVVLLRSFGPVNFKGLFSLAFRSPSLENLSLADPPNSLKPESTMVFELESSWDITRGIRLAANVFDIGITSPIAYMVNAEANTEGYQNLGRQGTRGVEVGFRARGGWGRAEASYSFYAPTVMENVATYVAPGHTDRFLSAPSHRASVAGTWKPLPWLGVSPTLTILGPRLGIQSVDDTGAATVLEQPTQVLANLFVFLDGFPAKGLFVGLGLYNLFGVDFSYLQAYRTSTIAGPLPGLDRELFLRLGYTFEPES